MWLHTFLMSTLYKSDWSASNSDHFTTGTHLIGNWVGLRAGFNAMVKIKSPLPAMNQTLVLRPTV